MATVVLSVVGTLVGGPVGGAIGAAIGQQIDRAVLGNGKPREGPRIKELDLQTSSYGTQIPAIYGAMRVAGTVIWATDLIERRTKSGGSKSRPSTVNYSYSASFAVALSSRPVARIGRIWADGNLLRGVAGDFKSETQFRFHTGHGDQALDPLLASAETSGLSPAYRGLAYALFEDFQLADYGNRIPSLTFEIFERDAMVPLAELAETISSGVTTGASSATVSGFAAQGADCRAALQPLVSTFPIIVRPDGEGMKLSDWDGAVPSHILTETAVTDGSDRLDRPIRSRGSNSRAPASLSIRHYEPERDYQTGIQSSRTIGPLRNAVQIDLPAAIGPDTARALANANLLQMWRGLNGVKASIPYSTSLIKAGDWLTTEQSGDPLRVTEVEYQRGTTRIAATEWVRDSVGISGADPGRNLPALDMAIGQTRLILADIPAMGTDDPGRALIFASAAGTGAGWRRASLSLVDGDREVELGGTRGVATIGQSIGIIPPHSTHLLDLASQPVIRLLNSAMTLPVGSGDPQSFDAPMLLIGGEIIRYGHAEKIGVSDYRISDLLRGCFGTSSDMVHADLSDVLLLDADTMLPLDSFPIALGSTLVLRALGLGDSVAVDTQIPVIGHAIRPRSPVHGRIMPTVDGGLHIEWKRRERLAAPWSDSTDVGNSEANEEYIVALFHNNLLVLSQTVSAPSVVLTAADLASLSILPQDLIMVSVVQQGRFARSQPLVINGTA